MLSRQIVLYTHKFSKYKCRFRKGCSAQHRLLAMLEKQKKAIDSRNLFEALLTDFSKAFDCLSLDLIVIQLNSYDFDLSALKLIHNYVTKRKQRTKMNHL